MTTVDNLIIESENPVNNRPQFQTEFGVSECQSRTDTELPPPVFEFASMPSHKRP